jgi:hypothetical protein
MKIFIHHDSLFGVPEVALLLNVCEATVRKMIKDGKLVNGHPVSNQGAFLVRGCELRHLMRGNPNYDWVNETFDIPDEIKTNYLMAAKDRCIRELRAAEAAMRANMIQLDQIMNELF